MGNLFTIIYDLPPGTVVRLKDDYPGVCHEVAGYEWYASGGYIVFTDGVKLNIKNKDMAEILKKGEPPMEMTREEILRNFKESKNKYKQIGILASLNACSKEEIMDIIVQQVPLTASEAPQECAEHSKTEQNSMSVTDWLCAKIDEVDGQIKTLEERYRKYTVALEVAGEYEKAGGGGKTEC